MRFANILTLHLSGRKRRLLPVLFTCSLCLSILMSCTLVPTSPPVKKIATPVPLKAGGEIVLPHSQILLHNAPLPNSADLNFSTDSWTLPGHDAADTRSIVESGCCFRQPAPAWFHSTGSGLFNAPVVTKKFVYLLGSDGFLHALATGDGSEQWRLPIGGEMTASGLALGHGLIYLALSGHYLAALDADTGKERWRFDTVGPVRSVPLVIGQDLLVASGSNSLFCLDALSGKEDWTFHSEDALTEFWPTSTAPAFSAGRIYTALGASTEFNALNLRTGRKEWEALLKERMTGGPVLDESLGLVYVVLWSGTVVAFDADSGQKRWEAHLASGSQSSPALSLRSGLLFIGDYSGSVYALDARTGRQHWRTGVEGAVNAAPLLVETGSQSRLFVATQKGACLMLDATNGRQLLSWHLGELRAAPVVAQNVLYQASLGDQGLFAFRL